MIKSEKPPVTIRRLKPEDAIHLEEAEQLFLSTGAWGNLKKNTLYHFCESPSCIVFGAFDEEKLIGSSVAGVMGERQFEIYKAYGSYLAEKLVTGQVVHIISTVLKDDYRGQGIGKEMLKVRMKWAREIGAKFVLSNSWVSKQKFNSARLFEADGFQVVTRFSSYNRDGRSDCPFCGNDCRCENIVFFKEISD